MKTLLLFVLCCCCTAATLAQLPTAHQIFEQSAAVLKANNLFQYTSEYRIKIFDSSDTSAFSQYNCTVARAPEDTILNYHARIYNNEEERIYDGENFFLIWHPTKKIITDNPYATGRNFAKNNIKREHIPSFLYAEKPFNTYLTDAVKTEVKETAWKNKQVWQVDVWLPTDAELTFFKRTVYLDKQSLLPVRVESFAKFQDIQDEYWEHNLLWKSAETSGLGHFNYHYTYPEGYEEEIFKPSNIDLSLLPTGTAMPALTGTDMAGNTFTIDSSAASGALVLLDFWYLGCTPCIRAMPEVNAIAEKYEEEGLIVLGINPMDDFKKRASDLHAFTEKMHLQYPQLSVEQSVSKAYSVKVFPAMYLINNGKVVYSHYGHSEEKMKALEKAIVGVIEK